jgi:hypothetical protein
LLGPCMACQRRLLPPKEVAGREHKSELSARQNPLLIQRRNFTYQASFHKPCARTDARKTWSFGLCFLHLRHVKGHPWRSPARRGLLQCNRNRSAGQGSSLNHPENCPKTGE